MKSMLKKYTNIRIILAIQIVISLILLFLVARLNMAPMKYLIIGIVSLIILILFPYGITAIKPKNNKLNNVGKIVSALLSVFLIIGSVYVYQGGDLISKITGAKTQTHIYSVTVMDNNEAKKISDLKNKIFGVTDSFDSINLPIIFEQLENEISNINTANYDSIENLASVLYDGKVNAIILNESYRGICEEKYPNFSTETRVVHQFKIEEKITSVTKTVDVTKNTFTIYISGIDTSGPVNTVSNSDVNLLITVNPNTRQILMTSIPRDMYITLASFGQKDKLTHAGIFGVSESVKSIENWLGININFYARVNFTSFVNIVDALGGITVNSPTAFTTHTGKINIVQGDNVMNGYKALCFVRERYALAGGDRGRGQNQMRVLTAIINKMMSPAIITNYTSVLNSISGSFQTNMESGDISNLIKMQLNDMSGWDIVNQQVDGTGNYDLYSYALKRSGVYVMVPNQDIVNSVVDKIKRVQNGEMIE